MKNPEIREISGGMSSRRGLGLMAGIALFVTGGVSEHVRSLVQKDSALSEVCITLSNKQFSSESNFQVNSDTCCYSSDLLAEETLAACDETPVGYQLRESQARIAEEHSKVCKGVCDKIQDVLEGEDNIFYKTESSPVEPDSEEPEGSSKGNAIEL